MSLANITKVDYPDTIDPWEARRRAIIEDRPHRIERRLAGIPSRFRRQYRKAVAGKSLQEAVTAMCLECTMWTPSNVHLCTGVACPLWAVRPFQESPEQSNKTCPGPLEQGGEEGEK